MKEKVLMLCHNGANNNIGGVSVSFESDELSLTRTEPCDGCLWRHKIYFEIQPEYEGFINLLEKGKEFVDQYYQYVDVRKKADNAAINGGYFTWEKLLIERYPNLSSTALACWVEGKK